MILISTVYWRNKIMDTMYHDLSSSLYVGLSSTIPSQDGSGVTEPSGNNYSRVPIGKLSIAKDGSTQNENDISFPQSSGIWFPPYAPAKCWVLFDGNEANSNVLCHVEFDRARHVYGNTQVVLPAGSVSFTICDYAGVVK